MRTFRPPSGAIFGGVVSLCPVFGCVLRLLMVVSLRC